MSLFDNAQCFSSFGSKHNAIEYPIFPLDRMKAHWGYFRLASPFALRVSPSLQPEEYW